MNPDTGAIALLRCLPTSEVEEAYRRSKADETEQGQHSAALIGRELQRRYVREILEDGNMETSRVGSSTDYSTPAAMCCNRIVTINELIDQAAASLVEEILEASRNEGGEPWFFIVRRKMASLVRDLKERRRVK